MHRAVEIYRAVEKASLKKNFDGGKMEKKTLKTFCPRNLPMFLVYNIV